MRILNNSVLIEPLKKVERSPGGIWFDLNQNDDEKLWRVVACGPGRTVKKKGKPPVLIPMEVAPGDRVLVDVALGCKLDFEDGTRRRIVDADQILMRW